MINGENVFDHRVKNDLRTYNNIWKISTGQGNDYTTGCLENCKLNRFKKTTKTRCWPRRNITN